MTSVVAIEIGIAEGVIAIVLPLIPGGAPYLPIAMALAPFAVKAINLAAEGLFELGKVMIHKIEQKTTSEMIAILQ